MDHEAVSPPAQEGLEPQPIIRWETRPEWQKKVLDQLLQGAQVSKAAKEHHISRVRVYQFLKKISHRQDENGWYLKTGEFIPHRKRVKKVRPKDQYGELTVLGKENGLDKRGTQLWRVRCICGNEKIESEYRLLGDYAITCGHKAKAYHALRAEKAEERVQGVLAHRAQGLTIKKIADMMGLKEVSVHKMLKRHRDRLTLKVQQRKIG